jgi:phosphate starvation-inducible protein PhoH
MPIKKSPRKIYTPQKEKRLPCKLNFDRAKRIPWTENQQTLIKSLTNKHKFTLDEQCNTVESLEPVDITCGFISGVAGTSKTLTSVYSALKLLADGKIEKIYYVRSAVDSSPHKLGFLPGSIDDKMGVYQSPLDDKLQELLPPDQIKLLMDGGFVKMESTCYLRGRNLANCAVIVDEAQNLVFDELVTIISRMAEKGRIWFCYDPKQSDLTGNTQNDIVNFANIFDPTNDFDNKRNGFLKWEFGIDDIVRSEFCKYVMTKLEAWEQEGIDKRKQEKYALDNNFDSHTTPPVSNTSTPIRLEDWSPNDN